MSKSGNKPFLFIDVSPLTEMEYTGISNVVYAIAQRFLNDESVIFDVRFIVFGKLCDRLIIEQCVIDRNGRAIIEAQEKKNGIQELSVDEDGKVEGRMSYGLFLNGKPSHRVFSVDALLSHDFSVIMTPECHNLDTINFHMKGMPEQISSSELHFTVSQATKNDLCRLYNVPKEKVLVSYLGSTVDTSVVKRARDIIATSEVEPYFLTLGTIEPRKNIDIVLSWIAQNPTVLQHFRFVFAGREGWGASFADYIEKYALHDAIDSGRIVHLGYVDESSKAMLLVGAQATIYASVFEGFGLPVLEAMALEVPVIASCSTSIPEVLGDTGYYFDPYSIKSFDEAIESFIFDSRMGYLKGIVRKAKERADTFSFYKTYAVIYGAMKSHFDSLSA